RCPASRAGGEAEGRALNHIGIGIVISLIASTFRVEIRQSEAAPNASEAATALINRDDATGAAAKPIAPCDRIIGPNPSIAGESPANGRHSCGKWRRRPAPIVAERWRR